MNMADHKKTKVNETSNNMFTCFCACATIPPKKATFSSVFDYTENETNCFNCRVFCCLDVNVIWISIFTTIQVLFVLDCRSRTLVFNSAF